MSRAVIFLNGKLENPGPTRALIQPGDILLAADGGARHALALGVVPTAILGDFDSLTQAETANFGNMGVHMIGYPPAKNETDFELVLSHAIRAGHRPILVLGGYGGRLDQSVANLALLAAPEAIKAGARMDDGVTEAFFIADQAFIHGQPGDTVSLLPWGAEARGVSTDALAYPLFAESLHPFKARGVSNQMLAETASVSLKSGLLLCIHIRKNQ